MMKKTLIATALIAAISTTALADGISGNVAMSSDYVWRGISQTDNQMAVSGGFDYSLPIGIYVGTWASNIVSAGNDPQIELDTYGGYKGDAGPISYDLGLIQYNYPGASDINTLELYAGGGYKINDMLSASAKYSYSSDWYDTGESAWRLEAALDVTLPMDFGLTVGVGKNDGDAFDLNKPKNAGVTDYVDYKVGLSKSLAGVDLGLTYTDTDLKKSECFDGSNVCDSKVVFSVSKSL